MDYQLELANSKIKELQERVIQLESTQVQDQSENLATIEHQRIKMEALYEQLDLAHADFQQYRCRMEDRLYRYEDYIDELEQKCQKLPEYEEYITLLEDKLDALTLRCNEQQAELDYHKRSLTSQIEKLKQQYSLRLIESQDHIIRLQRQMKEKDKENSIVSANSSTILEPMGEIQSELNKNIKLLNLKLRQYNS